MFYACIFNGDIGRLSQLFFRRPEKLVKTKLRLLYVRHEIPIANRHPKLARPVEYD